MIYQYNEYGSIPADVQNFVANKCSLLDRYVLFQTGEYQYGAIVFDPVREIGTQYTFTRSGNYNSNYTVSAAEVDEMSYSIGNEYYVYSNEGYGKALDLPVHDTAVAWSLTALCVLVFFGVMFKGVLFKCLRKRR